MRTTKKETEVYMKIFQIYLTNSTAWAKDDENGKI